LGLTHQASGKIQLDALYVHLAQAHHHEAREEEKHDVNQRNDLNPGFVVRNW
jgi:hypothetical protein